MTVATADDVLAHFGIKGMRWGVTKKQGTGPSNASTASIQAKPAPVSKEDRKAAKAAFKPVWDYSIDRMFSDGTISQKSYDSLSDKDVSYKKGHEFYRLSKRKDEVLRDLTYVSTNEADKYRYNAILSANGMVGKRKYSPTYEQTYKSISKLSSPSEKARIDAFSELFDTPSIPLRNGKSITGREYIKRQGYKKEAKRLTSHEIGLKMYNDFAVTQYAKSPLNTAYFNNLKSKGYNAVVDDNDRFHISQDPLIILTPNAVVKRMSVRQLTNQQITDAQKMYKMPDDPLGRRTIVRKGA